MGKKSDTFNVSLVQCFIGSEHVNTDYLEPLDDVHTYNNNDLKILDDSQADDSSDLETLDNNQADDRDDLETLDNNQTDDSSDLENLDNSQADDSSDLETLDNNQADDGKVLEPLGDMQDSTEMDLLCLDNRDNDELIEPLYCASIKSKILNICESHSETPVGIADKVVAKIPIVLAQLTIPFNISFTIDLPEPVLEIKDIKKNLKVTQCVLLQPTDVLFIKGFVRNSIKYSTNPNPTTQGIYEDIRNYSLDIPFECTTIVNFFKKPQTPFLNTKKDFKYGSEKDISRDNFMELKFNQIIEEFFNEPPFCKLLSSRIVELNELINPKPSSSIELSFKENSFLQIEEKMVIELKLEVLQNQNVLINSITSDTSE